MRLALVALVYPLPQMAMLAVVHGSMVRLMLLHCLERRVARVVLIDRQVERKLALRVVPVKVMWFMPEVHPVTQFVQANTQPAVAAVRQEKMALA